MKSSLTNQSIEVFTFAPRSSKGPPPLPWAGRPKKAGRPRERPKDRPVFGPWTVGLPPPPPGLSWPAQIWLDRSEMSTVTRAGYGDMDSQMDCDE